MYRFGAVVLILNVTGSEVGFVSVMVAETSRV